MVEPKEKTSPVVVAFFLGLIVVAGYVFYDLAFGPLAKSAPVAEAAPLAPTLPQATAADLDYCKVYWSLEPEKSECVCTTCIREFAACRNDQRCLLKDDPAHPKNAATLAAYKTYFDCYFSRCH